MRHSGINLTKSRYIHVFRGQESKAVAGLPDLGSSDGEENEAAATGTNGKIDLALRLARKDGKKHP
jgi:hypothetical protein